MKEKITVLIADDTNEFAITLASYLEKDDEMEVIGMAKNGNEAFDMLQAMNTGHEGSLTTLHANGVNDAIYRLESMVLMGEIELPVKAIREYIESAIDIVIEVKRLADGRRKVTNISEVDGFKDDQIVLKPIFEFREEGLDDNKNVLGDFVLYNYVPKVYDKIKKRGIDDLDDIFKKLKRTK